MSPVYICGLGAVTPAGWGVAALRDWMDAGQPAPIRRTEDPIPSQGRVVSAPNPRPKVLGHPRLRRSSSISQFAAAAAVEAVDDAGCAPADIGIIFSTMCGSVRYTQRFYAEARVDPATASPILFPETVFNAPASHIAAALGAPVPTYTLVGDSSVFLQALALGAQWVSDRFVRYSLVIAAEELDWSVTEGWRLFSPATVLAEGAAAICLSAEPQGQPRALLAGITDLMPFAVAGSPLLAAQALDAQWAPGQANELLVDGRIGLAKADAVENRVWSAWPGPRVSPKRLLGEGMSAAVGWQCVIALDRLTHQSPPLSASRVIAIGCNHQAVGAVFHVVDRQGNVR